jgi:SAM-dependent methyltransferase
MDVLDAGCGPGITTGHLLAVGADVTGIDVSPKMLAHARERVNNADFLRCDFGEPLPFESNRFDLVYSSLAFDYVGDWDSLFSELARVLRLEGTLVFSCGHPVADTLYFDPENYFETERVSDEWTSFVDPVEVPTYRRPLAAMLNPLLNAAFRLDRIEEARPTAAFRDKDPETFARVSREPTVLSVRAVMTAD